MIFHNLLGSILHRVVTRVLAMTMTSTSTIPIIRRLPRATAVYLGMMQQLGLLKPNPTSPVGVRLAVPKGMKKEMGGIMPTIGSDGEPVGFLLNADAFELGEADLKPASVANPISISRMQSAYARTDALSNTLTVTFPAVHTQHVSRFTSWR